MHKDPNEAFSQPFTTLPSEEKDLEVLEAKKSKLEADRAVLLTRLGETKLSFEAISRQIQCLEASNTQLESELKSTSDRLRSQIALKVKLEVQRSVHFELLDQYKTLCTESKQKINFRSRHPQGHLSPQVTDKLSHAIDLFADLLARQSAAIHQTSISSLLSEALLQINGVFSGGEKARDIPNHVKSARVFAHSATGKETGLLNKLEQTERKQRSIRKETGHFDDESKAPLFQPSNNLAGRWSHTKINTYTESPLSVRLVDVQQTADEKPSSRLDTQLPPDHCAPRRIDSRCLMQQFEVVDIDRPPSEVVHNSSKRVKNGYLSDYLMKIEKCASDKRARSSRPRDDRRTELKTKTARSALNKTEDPPFPKPKRGLLKQSLTQLEKTDEAAGKSNRPDEKHSLGILRRVESLLTERSSRNHSSLDKVKTTHRAMEKHQLTIKVDHREDTETPKALTTRLPISSAKSSNPPHMNSKSMRRVLIEHTGGGGRK